jgi:Complex I intermediate-associated protein 30 (CIA30)
MLSFFQFLSIKTTSCLRPFSSYRATFEAPASKWVTIQIPFAQFSGKGPGAVDNPFDTKALTRIGIVAIGKEMKVKLALSGLRFY